MVILCTCKVEK